LPTEVGKRVMARLQERKKEEPLLGWGKKSGSLVDGTGGGTVPSGKEIAIPKKGEEFLYRGQGALRNKKKPSILLKRKEKGGLFSTWQKGEKKGGENPLNPFKKRKKKKRNSAPPNLTQKKWAALKKGGKEGPPFSQGKGGTRYLGLKEKGKRKGAARADESRWLKVRYRRRKRRAGNERS